MAPVAAGCDVLIKLRNQDPAARYVDMDESQVKIKNGIWKRLVKPLEPNFTVALNPKGEINDAKNVPVELAFGCSKDRRYRFRVRTDTNSPYRTFYKPSENGWTRNTTITVNIDY